MTRISRRVFLILCITLAALTVFRRTYRSVPRSDFYHPHYPSQNFAGRTLITQFSQPHPLSDPKRFSSRHTDHGALSPVGSIRRTSSPGEPGDPCDFWSYERCVDGYTCATSNICAPTVSATVYLAAFGQAEVYISGKRIAFTGTNDQEVYEFNYDGPCTDIFVHVKSEYYPVFVSLAFALKDSRTYASGSSLEGYATTDWFPPYWNEPFSELRKYFRFEPVVRSFTHVDSFSILEKHFNAYPVTASYYGNDVVMVFEAPQECFAKPPSSPSLKLSKSHAAKPPVKPKPVLIAEGERCDSRLNINPCAKGLICGCQDVCVRNIKARITYAADDFGDMYVCGEKIAATNSFGHQAVVDYEGPCADIMLDVGNFNGAGGVSVAVEHDGGTYGSGRNLVGFSTTDSWEDLWELGRPGTDYSHYTPVSTFPAINGFQPYLSMINDMGAYPVTDALNPYAPRYWFRFPREFCSKPPPPAKPGQRCDSTLIKPCTDGHRCGCHGTCTPEISALITFAADDHANLYVCGKKIASTHHFNEKHVIYYDGPCADLNLEVRNTGYEGGASIAVQYNHKTFGSGNNLVGYSATSNVPQNWVWSLPGTDYSSFTPVSRAAYLEKYEPYSGVMRYLGAYPVKDATDPSAPIFAFRFPREFCFAAPPPSKPGKECDSTLAKPCTEGYICACHGRCVRKISAKIKYVGDDESEMFICGKKIASTAYWNEVREINYSGPCADIYVKVQNHAHEGGMILSVKHNGKTYNSGKNLTGFSTSTDIPPNWELGLPGFDYSSFASATVWNAINAYEPYKSMMRDTGADPVTDASATAKNMAFRFSSFCGA